MIRNSPFENFGCGLAHAIWKYDIWGKGFVGRKYKINSFNLALVIYKM